MPTLNLRTINSDTLPIPGMDPWHANATDPAVTVMTSFREHHSVTVADNMPIDAALEHMKHAGVRCAFAVDEHRKAVVGLVTAYDIMSEKPIQSAHTKRQDILVKDIMQRTAEWRVIHIEDLERATVGSVARLFDETRLTHIPVTETDAKGNIKVRGLLSSARVKRLLQH
jgi:CBS domain containing-hemolysin-like protein